jgi:hypothetical protein
VSTTRRSRSLFQPALCLAAFALAPSCATPAAPDLLAGMHPAAAPGVSAPELLTDGRAAPEGDDWAAPTAARFSGPDARVDYDLGRPQHIQGAYLQGDNNDEYVLSGSDDGVAFREIWVAPPVPEPGLRSRASGALDARARFVRLEARGGDGHYSVAELQLFADGAGAAARHLARATPGGAPGSARTALLYLVLGIGLALYGTRAGSSWRRSVPLALLAAAALAGAAAAFAAAWPLGGQDVSFARAAAAALVLLALGRAATGGARFPARRSLVVATAALGAALAFACFYNLGRPQFWNQARARPMFVHALDMRIYQPFAKYFRELRYDGIYLASVLAYAEDERGGSLASLGSVEIRDQRDYRMRPVSDLEPEIREVRARFSDARWAELKQDLAFFRAVMGPGYLGSLNDHGANAPPVWVFFARLLLGHVPASEASLTAAGLVDGALLLLMAVVLGITFGVLPMLAAMTVFGAAELTMFGTNWAGATLRHDWLVLLALGAAALKRRGWIAAGIALGLAAMLRLLPAVALAGVALAPVVWYGERWLRGRRPSGRELLAEHGGALRVLAAAAATIVVAFVATGLLYSFALWGEWWGTVRRLNDDLAVNEMNLRALVAGTDAAAGALYRARWPIILAAQLGGVAAVVAAVRGRPLEEAMLLSLPLMLLFARPVNYHDQFVFLLPLVAARGGLLGAAAPFLAMCVASYQAALEPDAGRRFQTLTVLLFAALGWFYANVLRKDRSAAAT